jgi:L-cysteate sulfo-lyase
MQNDDDTVAPLSLAPWPTPVERAPRLAEALGLGSDDLWFKRDDLIGLGGGGNKIRKLQYTCAQALAAGATTLITSGAAQSNHTRATAATAARLGLRCVLVLEGDAPEPRLGNLVLNAIAGATVIWAGDQPTQRHVDVVAADVKASGGRPFVIPFGGSSSFSARAYLECAREIIGQVPDIDNVVVAVGSGATMAGLVVGLGAKRVVGVHTGAVADPVTTVADLLSGIGDAYSDADSLRVITDQVGDGYASVTPASTDAILLTARTEGIFLDPIYTGRAMAGLVAAGADGTIRRGQTTVFLHSGGVPGLLAHPELATATPS